MSSNGSLAVLHNIATWRPGFFDRFWGKSIQVRCEDVEDKRDVVDPQGRVQQVGAYATNVQTDQR